MLTEREAITLAIEALERHAPGLGGCGDDECCGTYPEMEQDHEGEWLRREDVLATLESR